MNGYIRETIAETHENEVVDYSGKAERVHPVLEASLLQTAPGPAPTNLTIFSSNHVSVIGVRSQTPTVGVVIIRPEYFGFMWSQGRADVRINGELAHPTKLHSQGDQDGFHAVGGERMTTGFAVDRRVFVETVAALRGVNPEDVHLGHFVLHFSPLAASRFRSDVGLQIRRAVKPENERIAGTGLEDSGESIFGLLVDAFLHASPERVREDRSYSPEQIVRKAEERFFAAGERPVSLADLCAAANVSQSTLYRAFHHVCDQPPLTYFHHRRLHNARRKLVSSPAVRGAVKQIALSAGLTELGRFSVQYRRLFGESPSTTLNRNIRE